MASAKYPKFKQSILKADIDFDTATFKLALVTSAYTYSSSHQFRSSLSGVITTSSALQNITITDGVFDADDITLTAVAAGSTIAAIVIYRDTGSSATDDLIVFIDGFSVATDNTDVIINWSNGANKIFAL